MSSKKEKTTICDAAITAIAFSPDYSQVAFCPNNHQIRIASCSGTADCTKWKTEHVLEEHGQLVTGISWGKKTNRILSCAQDRTAFVWSQEEEDGTWTPCHVLLDSAVKRGLTDCAWNAAEDRVLISSAAFNVAVGRYDHPNPFWSCVVLAPHTSTITCVAPHPTENRAVATGSTDSTVKITLAKGRAPAPLVTFPTAGWVNALTWNEAGSILAFASHGGEVYTATGDPEDFSSFVAVSLSLSSLPLRCLTFVNGEGDDGELLIGGGHDFYPFAFRKKANSPDWIVEGKFAGAPKQLKRELSAAEIARAKFQNDASFGQQTAIEMPETKHSNTIGAIAAIPLEKGKSTFGKPSSPYAFATASMDGRIEFWSLDEMQ